MTTRAEMITENKEIDTKNSMISGVLIITSIQPLTNEFRQWHKFAA